MNSYRIGFDYAARLYHPREIERDDASLLEMARAFVSLSREDFDESEYRRGLADGLATLKG